MEVVGSFLEQLLVNHELPRRSCMAIKRPRSASLLSGMPDGNQSLHYAPKYRQSQLVWLIISIYSGVPESFEVFHCRPTSTEEELSLFLERVAKQPLRYLVLEVNKLPFRLQEVNNNINNNNNNSNNNNNNNNNNKNNNNYYNNKSCFYNMALAHLFITYCHIVNLGTCGV